MHVFMCIQETKHTAENGSYDTDLTFITLDTSDTLDLVDSVFLDYSCLKGF